MRRILFTAILALISVTSNAGIIDTTNNSFIDTGTGLEWMDFGVNNSHTPQHVWDNVGTLYPGWRAASESEVLLMWDNAFGDRGSSLDAQYSSGGYYSRYDDVTGVSVHGGVFDMMGYNFSSLWQGISLGWFEDDGGSLSNLYYYTDFITNREVVNAYGRGHDYELYRNSDNIYHSTMLVRDVTEPATIAIMGLGLAGIGWRRKVKTKR